VKYECLTHKIKVTIQENLRKYDSPPGSYAGVPQCKLLTMKEFAEGRFGPCEIRRVE
jgi:hypothetical protein